MSLGEMLRIAGYEMTRTEEGPLPLPPGPIPPHYIPPPPPPLLNGLQGLDSRCMRACSSPPRGSFSHNRL
eukprot:11821394-Karenia_brevis.AAC.1